MKNNFIAFVLGFILMSLFSLPIVIGQIFKKEEIKTVQTIQAETPEEKEIRDECEPD